MKRTAILLISAISAALLFHACSSDSGTQPVVVSSYSTYVASGSGTYFVTDDSLRVVPNNTVGTSSHIHGERLLLVWNFDAAKGITDPIYADITSTTGLMQGQSFMTDRTDTLGTAGADMYLSGEGNPIWRSGGIYDAPCMINIIFEYLTNNNGSSHEVYLSYSSNPFDTDRYFHMKFSHNTYDKTKLTLRGQDFCSFTLPARAYAQDTRGLVIEFDGLEGKSAFYKYTFSTRVMEKL